MAALWAPMLLLLGVAAAERRYLLTAPKASVAGELEAMCLTLFDVPETGELSVELDRPWWSRPGTSRLLHRQTVHGVAGGPKQTCFDVRMPEQEGYSGKMRLSVTFPRESNYTIKGERNIEIRSAESRGPEQYLFVQTDKYVYKPGQLVRFRVLAVDADLRPITTPFPLIFVETPLGTRVGQWRDERGPGGLVQLEFQLSEEPTLGDWTINVHQEADRATPDANRVHKKVFQVKEYVLPKFEVDVKGPPFILADSDEVTLKVCGIYTYGKPVAGNATLHLRVVERHRPYHWWRSHDFREPSLPPTVRQNVTGDADCAEFRLGAKTLHLLGSGRVPERYQVRAELTEAGTDITSETTKDFKVEHTKMKLTTDHKNNKYFKPGLPFIDRIKVTHPDNSPAAGETVRVCFRNSKSAADNVCGEITSDESGSVRFYAPPQDRNAEKLYIDATLPEIVASTREPMKVEGLQYEAKGWASNSGAFLQLSDMAGVTFTCGTAASIPVLFTGVPLGSQFELFYQVMSRGDLSPAVRVPVTFDRRADLAAAGLDAATGLGPASPDSLPAGLATLSVPVTPTMSTGFKLLVYAVREGEVVADSAAYPAAPCLENRVTLRWTPPRARPGQPARLSVSAAPGSVCGLDVVDKSVHLLGTKNRISLSEFFDRLKKLNLERHAGSSQLDDNAYCTAKHGRADDPDVPIPLPEPRPFPGRSIRRSIAPWRRHSYWTTTNVDTLTAFDDRAMAVMTDYVTQARTCVRKENEYPYLQVAYASPPAFGAAGEGGGFAAPSLVSAVPMAAGGPPQGAGFSGTAVRAPAEMGELERSPVPETVRTYFPETWLFDLLTVSEDGTATLDREVPDTVTEWVAGAVCSSGTDGLGISEPAPLTSFQPFFLSYTLPYSVKRGETLVLKVSVRNYNQHDLPVKLTLAASEEFETLSAPVETLCVSAGGSAVTPFRLRPSALGDVNITTVAEVYTDYPAVCGPETVLHFSDAVTRPVLVEPEGFEREVINSSFICGTTASSALSPGPAPGVSWPLRLPSNLVPGSERARVQVVGDLLGPSIDNLESLVRQPTGCGEQNMVLFAPNIHVMKYLVAVDELTETLKEKLVKHMKSGYQRELTYQHDDKSYSAFGNSDDSGSMWLTAFVVKSFGDAKKYVFIDEKDLAGSVRWIESRQQSDGCFPSVGRVLHKAMKGGVSSGGRPTLTAFVTIALLQSSAPLNGDTLSRAFQCMDRESDPDPYTLTLRTYARALAGHLDQARSGIAQLKDRAVRQEGMIHWRNSDSEENKALSVEMGAYNILTMVLLRKAGDEHQFTDALAAVRWINEQRNSRGGFVSTQDTVCALEALAAFSASLPRSSQANLRLRLTDRYGLDDVIRVTADNRLLLQSRDVTGLPGQVQVGVEGSGCALVQAVLKYNVQETDPNDALEISVTSKPKPSQSKCLKHIIETCVSYRKPGESNMAVVEVEMVSGFIPNKGSLKALKENTKSELKRWEVSKNKVVLYFDSLDGRRRCLELVVQREQEVRDVKPATATVYDYYQTEVALSTSYIHDMECATMAA